MFSTQAEAKRFDTWAKSEGQDDPAWAPVKPDSRRLSEFANEWWAGHGKTLRAGADTHKRLLALAESMGDPTAQQVREKFTAYRTEAAAGGKKLATINREHAYARAMFNELRRLGSFKGENPLKELRQFKLQQTELSFLEHRQIDELLVQLEASSNPAARVVASICLSTGARWSEAESMNASQIRGQLINFNRTKSYKNRSIPVSGTIIEMIERHKEKHPTKTGRLFESCYGAFLAALERTSIKLPTGQATHVLRHTFASHFMMGGGNILVLQRALGHSSLEMTMRYAHFAPDHMLQVVQLNPLSINREDKDKQTKLGTPSTWSGTITESFEIENVQIRAQGLNERPTPTSHPVIATQPNC